MKSLVEGWHNGSLGKGVCHQSDNLSLVPGTNMVEGENDVLKGVL